jgi:hypothetical protein
MVHDQEGRTIAIMTRRVELLLLVCPGPPGSHDIRQHAPALSLQHAPALRLSAGSALHEACPDHTHLQI